jgi:hypothetical protein
MECEADKEGGVSVTVVTVTSRIPDRSREPYYRYNLWHDSLTSLGCQPVVLGMGEHWGGLLTKPRRLRDWLRSGACTTDYLIVTDSYDVVFVASPAEVIDRYEESQESDVILFNAEKGLFPRGELEQRFLSLAHDDENDSSRVYAWKYLNSGFYLGPPSLILQLLESMWLDDIHDDYQRKDGGWTHPNDQGWYQTLFCAQPVPMTLDYRCEIVQCGSACSIEEFDLTGPKVKNIVTGTEPLVFHFNGGSKNSPEEGGIMHPMLRKWGMEHYL